jgi:hypothetical protein
MSPGLPHSQTLHPARSHPPSPRSPNCSLWCHLRRDFTAEPTENGREAFRGVPSPTRVGEGSGHSHEAKESPAARAGSHAMVPGCLVLERGTAGSKSPSRVEANAPMVQPDASPAPSQEEPAESRLDGGGNAESCPSLQDREGKSGISLLCASDHLKLSQAGLLKTGSYAEPGRSD